jgi:hypothetical protein
MTDRRPKILEAHSIADVWPLLSDEELEDLAEDIKVNGLHHPVVLYEEKILDGRNRVKACELAGVAVKTMKYHGEDPVGYAISLNEKRRHLSSSQRAALAVKMKPLFEAEAKKRQQAAGGNQNPSGTNQHRQVDKRSVVEKIPPATNKDPKKTRVKSRTQAAKALGTNERYVNQAEKIKKESPEVFKKVEEGEINIPQAMKLIRSTPQQDWSISELERKQQVEDGQAVLANEQTDLNLIAWAGADRCLRIDGRSRFANPYYLEEDGCRDEVCDLYEQTYLPNKKSILNRLQKLKGKVLICQCFPKRCHGESLLRKLDDD